MNTSSQPSPDDRAALEALNVKINALLPPRYQHCYDDVSPTSMGSASLIFGPDGKVAWNEIWTSFCDLALAGGPPHRGTLLEAVAADEVLAEPQRYEEVIEELARGLWLTTGLPILPRIAPAWVGVVCPDGAMADWLLRAVVAENIMARNERQTLYVPAGPRFRLEKEIKNIVTALAKTCHYWSGHMSASQRCAVSSATEPLLLEPASAAAVRAAPDDYQAALVEIENGIRQSTGLAILTSQALGWVGVRCENEAMAVWLLRAVVVANVLARREGSIFYLPVSLVEHAVRRVVATVAEAYRLWAVHTSLGP